MWNQTRITVYLVGLLGGGATLLALMGWATYDAATGMIDVNPFNVNWLAGIVAGPVSAAVATVAYWLGWSSKK